MKIPYGELFWDRKGDLIDITQWGSLRHGKDGLAYVRIGRETVNFLGDDIDVSTVWIGINHGWNPDRPPLIFETMCFGGPFDGECARYSTEEEAEAGHRQTVENLRRGEPPWFIDDGAFPSREANVNVEGDS